MQVIYPRCAGLDVHQKIVVVTAMITQEDGTVQREQRTFSTKTVYLLALDDCLRPGAFLLPLLSANPMSVKTSVRRMVRRA